MTDNPNSNNSGQDLPDGWTENKISDDTYELYIPQEQTDQWDKKRREKDTVNKLLKKNGFHIKPNGRSGTIYYVNNGLLCEVDFETSGVKNYDILVFFDNLTHWILPEKLPLTHSEKQNIKLELKKWLENEKIEAEL